MKLQLSAICDIGCKRSNNEDMLLAGDSFVRNGSLETTLQPGNDSIFIAVSDGMGGHNAGEVASEFVLRRFYNKLVNSKEPVETDQLQPVIEQWVKEIHHALNEAGSHNPDMQGMGCTLTGILFWQGKPFLLHVGDSRCYRFRGGYLQQLSEDHTLRNLVKDPTIPANKLVNSFGGAVQDIHLEFEALEERILAGDMLLICSDGLSGELSDEEMEEIINSSYSAGSLVKAAKDKGGDDNITCILIGIIE
jgi:protein phosphatase